MVFVRGGLNLRAQFQRRRLAVARHHIVQIHARQILGDLALRKVLEQVRGVGILVGPIEYVGDLKLYRDADGDEAHRRRLEHVVGVGIPVLNQDRAAVAHEEILFPAVGDTP